MTPRQENRCCATVFRSRLMGGQCAREGKVCVDGNWYCSQHDPEAVKVKRDDAMAEARVLRGQQEALRIQGEERAAMLGAGFPPLGDDEVRGIGARVLLVTGALSPTLAHLWTDRLEELLPIVERINIPEASHLMHEQNASAANEAILGFLGRHREMSPPSP